MVRADIQTGGLAGDVTLIPTNSDTMELEDKMNRLKKRMDNTVHLYHGMVDYEQNLVKDSSSLTTFIVLASQLVAVGIVISGVVGILALKKSIHGRKSR
jgi:hypothetical protein